MYLVDSGILGTQVGDQSSQFVLNVALVDAHAVHNTFVNYELALTEILHFL